MMNNTKDGRLRQAQKDDNTKRALELVLMRKLLTLFRNYSKSYKKALALGLNIPNVFFFREQLEKVLSAHYQKVSNKFETNTVDFIGKPENHVTILNNIKTTNDIHNQIRLADSLDIITNTTRNDAFKAHDRVKADALAAGVVLSSIALARRAKLLLDIKFHKRIPIIAATETQNSAEHAKFAEALHLENVGAIVNPKKQWLTMRDNLVRPMHVEAYKQIVPLKQPFDVGGQALMYPGDSSLGASINNTINCRCVLVIIF